MEAGEDDFDPSDKPIKVRAIGGAAATGLAQAAKLLIQFASVVILARLLEPSDFGVFAMVMPLVSFAVLLQGFGFMQAIIQGQALTQRQTSALFWVSFLISASLAGIVCLSTPLVSALYHEPRAGALAYGAALLLVLAGFVNIPYAIANRRMLFGALAATDAVGALVGLAVAASASLMRAHEWALLWGTISTSLVTLAGAWLASGWLPKARPDFRGARELMKFGGGVLVGQLADFVARSLDRVLIGRYVGGHQLGLYDRAYKLLMFPLQQINAPLGRVMLPVFSRLNEEPARYRRAYLRVFRQIMLVSQPGIVFMGVTAPVLMAFVMGEKWAGAAPIFAWLALAALHQPASATMGWLFVSQGRTGAYMAWSLFSAATCAAAFVIGLRWGALGVAAAYALSDVSVRLPALWWWVTRRGPVRMGDLYRAAAPFAAAAVVSAAALFLLKDLPYPHAAVELAVSALASYLASAAVVWMFRGGRETIEDAVGICIAEWRKLAALRKRA